MRYIDNNLIHVPDNWIELANNDKISPIWSFFKNDIEQVFGKKCWYSEDISDGAKNNIDHFRPKAQNVFKLTKKNADLDDAIWNSIDAKSRLGYLFLENTFSNYRYSCEIVNTLNRTEGLRSRTKAKGKSNFFPLKAASPHGTDSININQEIICLLDPCDKADPALLSFKETGLIEPDLSVGENSWEFIKVKVSIEIYHLHYYRFIERRKNVWESCSKRIRLAYNLYGDPNNSKMDNIHLVNYIVELKESIKITSDFSAVAIDCIRHYKRQNDYAYMLEHFFPNNTLIK